MEITLILNKFHWRIKVGNYMPENIKIFAEINDYIGVINEPIMQMTIIRYTIELFNE